MYVFSQVHVVLLAVVSCCSRGAQCFFNISVPLTEAGPVVCLAREDRLHDSKPQGQSRGHPAVVFVQTRVATRPQYAKGAV